ARNGEALEIERNEQGLLIDIGKGNVQDVRHALGAVAVDVQVRESGAQPALELVTQRAEPLRLRGLLTRREFCCNTKRDCAGNVLRAWTQIALLPTTVNERNQLGAAAHVERTNTLRCTDFVSADCQRCALQLVHPYWHASERLDCVGVYGHSESVAAF